MGYLAERIHYILTIIHKYHLQHLVLNITIAVYQDNVS